jgi:hypothetical protein
MRYTHLRGGALGLAPKGLKMKLHEKLAKIAVILDQASARASSGGLESYLLGRLAADIPRLRADIALADKMLKEIENEKHR